jgi:hypothetical protein
VTIETIFEVPEFVTGYSYQKQQPLAVMQGLVFGGGLGVFNSELG